MAGLALACGGASALNHVLDADIDRLMGERTEKRPVAAGRVTPARGLEFGLALSALSFVLLASTVNVLTAALALVGNLFYVLVYTRWLKRSTPQNIVIGGAAGAVPPLVGYAAATGNLGLPALWLFLIVFLWTPPHFWALALLIKENYASGQGADAARRPRRRGDDAADRPLLARARRVHARRRATGSARSTPSPQRCSAASSSAWRGSSVASRRAETRVSSSTTRSLYLALLFVAAAVESGAPVKDLTPELERKNLIMGWALFGVFLLLFAGTVGVALLYLALD